MSARQRRQGAARALPNSTKQLQAQSQSSNHGVPATPGVVPPSPATTGGDGAGGGKDFFGDGAAGTQKAVDDGEGARSRSRSRDRPATAGARGLGGLTPLSATDGETSDLKIKRQPPGDITATTTTTTTMSNGGVNGHLSPLSAAKGRLRALSRSPSPLGLIPIHQEWREFVHRHEIPRKLLHVSIGFLTLALYAAGYQKADIHPVLLGLLVPIALTDFVRRRWPALNAAYVRALGAFMRESEAHERYNGVIWYLLGAWAVMRYCRKDVAIASVLLLSWCDAAASTVGRLYGRRTPRLRRGKSLAGSLAALVTGVLAALLWWGWVAPRFEPSGGADDAGANASAFRGALAWPGDAAVRQRYRIEGAPALAVLSLVAGLVGSASEAVDVLGLDDNLTIPVLAGLGLGAFLRVFGVDPRAPV